MVKTLSLTGLGVITLLGLAACATGPVENRVDEAVLAKLNKYEQTGESRTCLSITSLSSIDAVSETKFLVRSGVRTHYLNETNGRCSGATRNGTFLTYTTSNSQLCRNEIIRVVDNLSSATIGSCSLGEFKELKLKEVEEEADAS